MKSKAESILKDIHNRKKTNSTDTVGRAALTHYLHNRSNGSAKFYQGPALKYLEQKLVADDKKKTIDIQSIVDELVQNQRSNIRIPSPENPKFKFIDLFAGIGGFRLAMQNLGGECLFTSEWDEQAQKTYYHNFGEIPFGDITLDETKSFIPDGFDVLCAGFPCQAFSIAGKRGGFEDTRGTLFFDVAEIIKRKQPRAIFLENVKGLMNHDRGKTLSTILNVLRNDLDYYVPEPQIVNAKDFGVPQNRERIFIVGFRKDQGIKQFNYPKPSGVPVCFKDVKEEDVVSVKYYLSETYLSTLREHKKRHADKGNGFGYGIIADDAIANAVVCGGMGRERNLVYDDRLTDFTPVTNIKGEVNREGIRKMTPKEWKRLQGFNEEFDFPVADASAYKQLGNSVAVPAIQATAEKLINAIIKNVPERHR